jgi:hypothetical protein
MKEKEPEPYNFQFMSIKESTQGSKKYIKVAKYKTSKYDYFYQDKPISKIINPSCFKDEPANTK